MPRAGEATTIPVVDKSKSSESLQERKEERVESTIDSAVEAVGVLTGVKESLVAGQNKEQLTAQFKEEVGNWGNKEAVVVAINRFVWSYRNCLKTFKERFRPSASLDYLVSIKERRKGEGLANFVGNICADVEKGGKAWKKAHKRLMAFADPRKEEFFGGQMVNARELMLGALVEGYLKSSGEFSAAEGEEEIIRTRDARGRYAMAVARVCKGMPGMHKLDQQQVSGALHTIAEGLGIWEAPEHS